MQHQKKMPWDSSNKGMNQLKAKFEELQQIPISTIQVPNREVKLSAALSCGCGSGYVEIERTVPFDSPLHDGDKINESGILPTDRIIS